jgi:preprotein translocase subunit SecB
MGYFEIIIKDKELAEQKIINYYKVNGVAILFPYLRSLISDMTSKGSETPIILPTINVAAMLKDVENKREKHKKA